jgi:hypothetical protein
LRADWCRTAENQAAKGADWCRPTLVPRAGFGVSPLTACRRPERGKGRARPVGLVLFAGVIE